MDTLYICFVTTTNTSNSTIPSGDGSSYTLFMKPVPHPDGLTNQDYMKYTISDARKNKPNIRIVVTLDWGDGSLISKIFSTPKYSPEEAAKKFAANLMVYLKHYDLDGFDIDWEFPISQVTTRKHFTLFVDAIGAQFKQQTDKHYCLTLSAAEVGTLNATAVNTNVDYLNLQLYSGFTDPEAFKRAGVNPSLFAYGAKFEGRVQTASEAFQDNERKYHYNRFTCWRLNSNDYLFEQAQVQQLYRLCNRY